MYHPRVGGLKNQIMIKVILKAFLFVPLTVVAGVSPFSLVSHAQQSTVALTGEWVGNSEASGHVRVSVAAEAIYDQKRRPCTHAGTARD